MYTISPLSERNKAAALKKHKAAESQDSKLGRQVKKLKQQLEQAKSSRSTTTPTKLQKHTPIIIGCIMVKKGATIVLPPQ